MKEVSPSHGSRPLAAVPLPVSSQGLPHAPGPVWCHCAAGEDLLRLELPKQVLGRTPRLRVTCGKHPALSPAGWVPGFRLCRGTRRTSPGSAGCHPGTASWGCRSRTHSAQGCSSTTPAHMGGRQPLGRTENRELKCFCCTDPSFLPFMGKILSSPNRKAAGGNPVTVSPAKQTLPWCDSVTLQ